MDFTLIHLLVALNGFHIGICSLVSLSMFERLQALSSIRCSCASRWDMESLSAASIGVVQTRWIIVSLSGSKTRTWLWLLVIWGRTLICGGVALVNNALSAGGLWGLISFENQICLTCFVWKLLAIFLVLMFTKKLSSHVWDDWLIHWALGIRVVWNARVRWPLSSLVLSSAGTYNTIRVSNGISTPLSLRSVILRSLKIIGQICSTFINGRIHNLAGSFGIFVCLLMAIVIFVHDHWRLLLLRLQLIESLV